SSRKTSLTSYCPCAQPTLVELYLLIVCATLVLNPTVDVGMEGSELLTWSSFCLRYSAPTAKDRGPAGRLNSSPASSAAKMSIFCDTRYFETPLTQSKSSSVGLLAPNQLIGRQSSISPGWVRVMLQTILPLPSRTASREAKYRS